MHLVSLILVSFISSCAYGLAPLEPNSGKILIGAWYDRNNSDTPSAINSRIGYKPLAFFQVDVDFSGIIKPWTSPSVVIPQFVQQLQETGTNAAAMLTVYPFQGLGNNITDAQLQDMAKHLNGLVNAGHSVFFRFAPEMNGNWFGYGQDPETFISTWKRCITYWRKALGSNVDKVAFVWSPNSGNGYPYPGGIAWPNPKSIDPFDVARVKLMDTNQNGILDKLDNPYTPFYPGDDFVDWVGLSIYHYGIQWPWVNNSIPEPNKFENYLEGNVAKGDDFGYFPFYSSFAGPTGCTDNITQSKVTNGNKPFIVSETAATYHFAWVDPTTPGAPIQDISRVEIKQAWWQSFLNANFVSKYPQMKAVSTFEFIKSEELTWRDFTAFGGAPNPDASNTGSFVDLDQAVANAFVTDAQSSMPFLEFAIQVAKISDGGNGTGSNIGGGNPVTVSGNGTRLGKSESRVASAWSAAAGILALLI